MSKLTQVIKDFDDRDARLEADRPPHMRKTKPDPSRVAPLALVDAAAKRLAEDNKPSLTYKIVRGHRLESLPLLIEEAAIEVRSKLGYQGNEERMETLERYLKAVSIEEQVTALLSDGWTLHGPGGGGDLWVQTMIKLTPSVTHNLLD